MELKELLEELLRREGGFVNDPDDPGGATNFGITIGTLSMYRGKKVSVSDVRNLTIGEAKEIYYQRYLVKPKIDQLPIVLMPSVFDMYVNAGSNAIKILQETLNGFGAKLDVDGGNGPITIAASHQVFGFAGQYLVDAYGIERRDYYYALADRRPASRKYARTRAGGKGGWIKRAEEFLSARFRFTEQEHKQRVSAWG